MCLTIINDLVLKAAGLGDDEFVEVLHEPRVYVVLERELGGPGLYDVDAPRLHHRDIVGTLVSSDI